MNKVIGAIGLSALLVTAGCSNLNKTEERALSGAAIGAGVGAGVGALTGGLSIAGGAAIGAGAGAATGLIVDALEDDDHR